MNINFNGLSNEDIKEYIEFILKNAYDIKLSEEDKFAIDFLTERNIYGYDINNFNENIREATYERQYIRQIGDDFFKIFRVPNGIAIIKTEYYDRDMKKYERLKKRINISGSCLITMIRTFGPGIEFIEKPLHYNTAVDIVNKRVAEIKNYFSQTVLKMYSTTLLIAIMNTREKLEDNIVDRFRNNNSEERVNDYPNYSYFPPIFPGHDVQEVLDVEEISDSNGVSVRIVFKGNSNQVRVQPFVSDTQPQEFNIMDKGNLIKFANGRFYCIAEEETKEKLKEVIRNGEIGLIDLYGALIDIFERAPRDGISIEEVQNAIKRKELEVNNKIKKEKLITKKREKLKDKISKGERTKLDSGVILHSKKMEFDSLTIEDPEGEYEFLQMVYLHNQDFYSILRDFIATKFFYRENFNDYFIRGGVNKLRYNGKDVEVYKGNDGRYRINGYKVLRDDIYELLLDIVCYDSVETYNEYLKKIETIPHKYMKYISNNLEYEIDLKPGQIMRFRFDVDYHYNGKRVEYYIKTKNHKKKIKGFGEFLNRKINTVTKLINQLMKHLEVNNFADIRGMLDEAVKEYIDAIKKSEEMLAKAVKSCGATRDKGYIYVTGQSGTQYKIDESNAQVSKKVDEDRWMSLCVVDSNNKNHVGKDSAASRLYALKNDKLVADQITTLKV